MNISVSISGEDKLGIEALEAMKLKLKATRQSLSNEFRNWLIEAHTSQAGMPSSTVQPVPTPEQPSSTVQPVPMPVQLEASDASDKSKS